MKTINYLGMLITELESQTVGNCIDFGISTEKTKSIIETMRLEKIDYLSKKEISKLK